MSCDEFVCRFYPSSCSHKPQLQNTQRNQPERLYGDNISYSPSLYSDLSEKCSEQVDESTRPVSILLLNSKCLLLSYFTGDTSTKVDEHFHRSLAQPCSYTQDKQLTNRPICSFNNPVVYHQFSFSRSNNQLASNPHIGSSRLVYGSSRYGRPLCQQRWYHSCQTRLYTRCHTEVTAHALSYQHSDTTRLTSHPVPLTKQGTSFLDSRTGQSQQPSVNDLSGCQEHSLNAGSVDYSRRTMR